MMIIRYMVILSVIGLFSSFVFAQMYQYKDEEGNFCFTDDLTRVPTSQHETIKAMGLIKNSSKNDGLKESAISKSDKAAGTGLANNFPKKNAQELKQIKEELDNIHKSLQEKRAFIQAKKPSEGALPEEFNTFQKKVLEFNAEVEVYQKKQEEFEEHVKEFNNWINRSIID